MTTPAPVEAKHGLRSIDDDPELWHGLTLHAVGFHAQVQRFHEFLEFSVLELSVGGTRATLPPHVARELRDLLNIATARGFL